MKISGRRRAGGRSLDFLNLFVANIQTGFGPFIAVYLTTRGWTQTSIGIALSIGTIAAMVSQIPAGALVDKARRKSAIAGLSLLAFSICALLFAIRPTLLTVYFAEVLHGFASCTLGPCVAAMSLAIAGRTELAARFGRNARFSSIGNAMGAALLGAAGYYLSSRSVFFLAAALSFPAIALMWPLRALDARASPRPHIRARASFGTALGVFEDSRLLVFGASVMLFTVANASLMLLVSSSITEQLPVSANLLIAAFIILPQFVVAAVSPAVARYAQNEGRRTVMLVALTAVTMRALLFALIANPVLLIPVQVLDGVAAACIGILVPLVTADVAGNSGHYNFALGVIGFAIGIGGTISTTISGVVADRIGDPATLLCLSVVGLVATVFAVLALPETRPSPNSR